MKTSIYTFITGLSLGILICLSSSMYKDYKQEKSIKFKISDCLNNGLFAEKILGIEKSTISLSGYVYLMQGYIQHKKLVPTKEHTNIIDDRYVLIDQKYCN